LIITLWPFQILNNYSYRKTLEKAKDEGFDVLLLCDCNYRVKQLDDEALKLPFIADKGYDTVDIIESLLDRGFKPTIGLRL
jgi:hypothetical protein